jgi:hypothetical protein
MTTDTWYHAKQTTIAEVKVAQGANHPTKCGYWTKDKDKAVAFVRDGLLSGIAKLQNTIERKRKALSKLPACSIPLRSRAGGTPEALRYLGTLPEA